MMHVFYNARTGHFVNKVKQRKKQTCSTEPLDLRKKRASLSGRFPIVEYAEFELSGFVSERPLTGDVSTSFKRVRAEIDITK